MSELGLWFPKAGGEVLVILMLGANVFWRMVCFQQDCYVAFRGPGISFQGYLKSDRSLFWYTVCSEQDYNPYFHALRILFLDRSVGIRSVWCAITRS